MTPSRGHWPSCPKDRPGDCSCLTHQLVGKTTHGRPRVLFARGSVSHISRLPRPRTAQRLARERRWWSRQQSPKNNRTNWLTDLCDCGGLPHTCVDTKTSLLTPEPLLQPLSSSEGCLSFRPYTAHLHPLILRKTRPLDP